MQRQSKKPTKRTVQNAQLEEFETRDLGTDIRTSGVTPVVISPKSQPTSILLDEDLVKQLRTKAAKRGVGYQTMLKIIVREHLDEH